MKFQLKNKSFSRILISVLFLLFFAPTLYALELTRSDFLDKHFAGGRIGLYSSVGDEAPVAAAPYLVEFSKGSIYGEFFYAYRIGRPLSLEFSAGILSRGEVQFDRINDAEIGPVFIYPFWLSAKIYPLYKADLPFHFFIQPGGGLIYARHEIIFYFGYTRLYEHDSKTKFTYSIGTGVDWPIAGKISLTANFKYIPMKFGSPLAGYEDYSGWTLTFGAGYTFGK